MRRRLPLILGGALFAVLLVEVLLRVSGAIPEVANPLHSFHASDPALGWRGKPDVTMRFRRPDFDALVAHDADGWRVPDPQPPADVTRRLLVLGDSFTWGWGVSQGELFTDHLQRALPGVAVVNRGVNAYSTGQEYLVLQRELASSRYDAVLLLFFYNDVKDNADRRRGRRPVFTVEGERLVPPGAPAKPLRGPLQTWFREHSRAFQLVSYVAGALGHGFGEPPMPMSAPPGAPPIDYRSLRGAAVTQKLLAAMAEAAAAHGARFAIVYVPQRSELGGLNTLPAVQAVHDLVRETAAARGIPLIDLTADFAAAMQRGEVVVFPHDQHWNAAGHRLAASLLLASPVARLEQLGGGGGRVAGVEHGADDGHAVRPRAAHGPDPGGIDPADPEQRQ